MKFSPGSNFRRNFLQSSKGGKASLPNAFLDGPRGMRPNRASTAAQKKRWSNEDLIEYMRTKLHFKKTGEPHPQIEQLAATKLIDLRLLNDKYFQELEKNIE